MLSAHLHYFSRKQAAFGRAFLKILRLFITLSAHLHYFSRKQAAFGRAFLKILRLFITLSAHLHYFCKRNHPAAGPEKTNGRVRTGKDNALWRGRAQGRSGGTHVRRHSSQLRPLEPLALAGHRPPLAPGCHRLAAPLRPAAPAGRGHRHGRLCPAFGPPPAPCRTAGRRPFRRDARRGAPQGQGCRARRRHPL